MIKVTINRRNDQSIYSFLMSGHAESGPYGYDLVCAGASAVSFGAVNAVTALCEAELEIDLGDNGGFLQCILPEDESSPEAQILLEGMVVSLRTIAADYSEHISISDHGR